MVKIKFEFHSPGEEYETREMGPFDWIESRHGEINAGVEDGCGTVRLAETESVGTFVATYAPSDVPPSFDPNKYQLDVGDSKKYNQIVIF